MAVEAAHLTGHPLPVSSGVSALQGSTTPRRGPPVLPLLQLHLPRSVVFSSPLFLPPGLRLPCTTRRRFLRSHPSPFPSWVFTFFRCLPAVSTTLLSPPRLALQPAGL